MRQLISKYGPVIVGLGLFTGGFFGYDALQSIRAGGLDVPKNACVLNEKTCSNDLFSAALSSSDVSPLIPVNLVVETHQAMPFDTLDVVLEGIEMNMGIYKLKLNKMPAGHFEGIVQLPVCREDVMTWRGWIKTSDNIDKMAIEIRAEK
ncbi:hypothetical protein NF212_24660 [Parasalinivibrio latis]|uniref:hypothetical protein n=1 Tax=Parasalinivibrio latis TaxID=2952610 RepID=UPI0030E3D1B8